ncbi:tetratricopeptide repeat protein [uncultured Psychrobacter sp.]|uniref:tetratricopeptide repeat protein n=1 Tax=uncultured Psychrobacter sp. TaxID=259303 RepID=UPI00345AC560
MSATSAPAMTKTSLSTMAENYWQDFIAARPTAGGIAYEAQLRDCQLDETLISLQRVDMLITHIRRERMKKNILHEDMLVADERYRRLLLFLAFYAGRVLAKQWQSEPQWYDQLQIHNYYPKLPLAADDFYQQMAMKYHDSKEHADNELFFALEPIGLRLFGSADRKFMSVQGETVASGLYQAVKMRLPNFNQSAILIESNVDQTVATNLKKRPIENQSASQNGNDEDLATDLASNTISETAPSAIYQDKTPQDKTLKPTPDIFNQLLVELDKIEIPQNAGNEDYRQACQMLDQFEDHIAQQKKPRTQVMFSKEHEQARLQALKKLTQAANDGHTGAMLRLAMYELLGEGLMVDSTIADDETDKQVDMEAGVVWVKKAANHAADSKDSRAQRLLSKMYYQGIGVPQDIESGKYWLEQAAANGHDEAAQVIASLQQAQLLITTKQAEQHSIKRYQLLIAAIVIGALLLLIFV